MEKATDPYRVADLGLALGQLPVVPPECVDRAITKLLAAVPDNNHLRILDRLARALVVLKVSARQSEVITRSVLSAVEVGISKKDVYAAIDLGQAAEILSMLPKAPRPSAEKVIALILEAVSKSGDLGKIQTLGRILAALGPSPHEVEKITLRLLQVAGGKQDTRALRQFATALTTLPNLPEKSVERAADLILGVMDRTVDSAQILDLAEIIERLGKLPASRVEHASGKIVGLMEAPGLLLSLGTSWGRVPLYDLGLAFGKLPSPPAECRARAAKVITAALDRATTQDERIRLAQGLAALGEVSDPDAEKATRYLLAELEKTDNRLKLDAIAEFLAIAARAPSGRSEPAIKPILVVLTGTSNSSRPTALARSLGNFSEGVDKRRLINILKFPTCRGEFQSVVLRLLERQTSERFDNDVWQVGLRGHTFGLSQEELRSSARRWSQRDFIR
jgi:hypothetical protein